MALAFTATGRLGNTTLKSEQPASSRRLLPALAATFSRPSICCNHPDALKRRHEAESRYVGKPRRRCRTQFRSSRLNSGPRRVGASQGSGNARRRTPKTLWASSGKSCCMEDCLLCATGACHGVVAQSPAALPLSADALCRMCQYHTYEVTARVGTGIRRQVDNQRAELFRAAKSADPSFPLESIVAIFMLFWLA